MVPQNELSVAGTRTQSASSAAVSVIALRSNPSGQPRTDISFRSTVRRSLTRRHCHRPMANTGAVTGADSASASLLHHRVCDHDDHDHHRYCCGHRWPDVVVLGLDRDLLPKMWLVMR